MINSISMMAKAAILGISLQPGAGSDLGVSVDSAYATASELVAYAEFCTEDLSGDVKKNRRDLVYSFAKHYAHWIIGQDVNEKRILVESNRISRPTFVIGTCKKLYDTISVVNSEK